MEKIIKIIQKPVKKYIISPLKAHFSALYNRSDPITYHQCEGVKPMKRHFVSVILFLAFNSLYGTIGLSYESGHDFSLSDISNNAYIYTHQTAPRQIWSQIDFCLTLDTIGLAGVMLVFIFPAEIQQKYKIVLQNYNTEEAAKIAKIRGRPMTFVRLYVCGYYIGCMTWFWFNLLFNGVYHLGARSIFYWTVIFPLAMCYIVYALFDANLFIVLASRYITIKQQTLLAKFIGLNQVLVKHGYRLTHWRQYIALHTELVHISRTIRQYSRFGTPLLSVIIPYYIAFQCYLGYVIFMTDLPGAHKQILIMAVVLDNLLLFSLTRECARIVSFNKRIESQSVRFYLSLVSANKRLPVPCAILFRAGCFQESRRLHLYAFRLFDNYRITTRTFYVLITYISTFFMYISTKQYKLFKNTFDQKIPNHY